MSTYPLLSRLRAPATLTPQFRTMLLAAGHVAAGDAVSATAAFQHLESEYLAKAYELCLLQSSPLIGIPRVLHSAAAIEGAGIHVPPLEERLAQDGLNGLRERGESTFRAVYGRYAERVLGRLRRFHPVLQEWVVTHTYGRMLSREGVTLRERELCIVACLTVDPVAGVQLASHLRGALNVGASKEEVEAVVAQTEVVKKEAAEGARAVWESLERARYAL